MSGHVELEIADFVAGRLSDERRRQIEDHMKECDPCRNDVRWAVELRDEALRQGLRHLDPMRTIALSADASNATEAELAHLDGCKSCRGELEWAKSAPDEDAETEPEPAPRRRGSLGPWALAVAAIVVLAFAWMLAVRTPPSTTGLARIEPLPVHATRSVVEAGSFEEQRLLGLEAYVARDWETAREAFGRAVEMRPEDPEMWLYLGSTALLLGDAATAMDELALAAELAGAPALRDEATWQLANAELAAGRPADAERHLRDLADDEDRRAADARALLSEIRDRR